MKSVSDSVNYTKKKYARLITIPFVNYDYTTEPPQTFTQPLTFEAT